MTSTSTEQATSDRIRKDLNGPQILILEEAWTKGMTNTKKTCHALITKVASELELSEEKVKIWIGNRRARDSKTGNPKVYPKTKGYSRGPTAYSLFASSQPKGDMDGAEYLKKIGEQWKSLDPVCVKKFQAESKELRCSLLKGRTRSEVISQELKIIQNSIMTLAEVEYAIGGFGTDPKDILNTKNDVCFITSKTETFFTRDMFDDFKHYICKSDVKTTASDINVSNVSVPPKGSEKKKSLRRRLRKHFRQCWEASTGLESAVPYKTILDNGAFKVDGLPHDLQFKEPHLYSISNMERMLKLPITFHPGNVVTEKVPDQQKTVQDLQKTQEQQKTVQDLQKTQEQQKTLQGHEAEQGQEHGKIKAAEQLESNIEESETLGEIIAEQQEEIAEVSETTDLDLLMRQVSKKEVSETAVRRKRKAPKRKYTTKKKLVQESKLYEVEKIVERKEGQVYVKWLVDGSFSWLPEENLVESQKP